MNISEILRYFLILVVANVHHGMQQHTLMLLLFVHPFHLLARDEEIPFPLSVTKKKPD